jgi:hypothetical protein
MFLVVPIECAAESEDESATEGDPTTATLSRPLSLQLLRVCFLVFLPRRFECEPDEPWGNLRA